MKSDTLELNILIFVTCENATFKHRYAIAIKQWLSKVSETFDKKPVLKFTEVNIITSGIPKLDEIKKHHGIVISGSFSRTWDNKPWMERLRHTIRLCYVNQIPIFGICFGFQILSQAFGSSCEPSPHGFNFGGFIHKLNDKALPFFRPFMEDFYNDENAYRLFDSDSDPDNSEHNHCTPNHSTMNGFTNNKDSLNNHSNATNGQINDLPASEKPAPFLKNSMDSMLGAFSHNDIVTSLPNIDNIDFGDISYTDRTELYESLSDLVPITISSLAKVPFVGLLIGNKSKTFMAAIQLHPEFDTVSGKKFCKEILNLKINQGVITVQQYDENLEALKFSNSGYVYGKMALSLFMNGHLRPKY
ncbi:hypothetical protein MACK_000954 [Theileria orientalis]|uniref:Glutamine amidotransferase domain-containing protein n=1 Tax=Theileria orientalis TaxID=68886 RepID=A0A976QSI3_THEOR|nr:hypothetical protein MACK_000954 [Theileria orientalis]